MTRPNKHALTELQERTLRALHKRAGRYIRFRDAKMNGCAMRLCDRGYAIALAVNGGAMQYCITDAGCTAIGEKPAPPPERFHVTVGIDVSALSGEHALQQVRDALKSSYELALSNAKFTIRAEKGGAL